MEFETKVAGIPCICKVLDYTGYKPMRITGTGFGDAEPPEYANLEFEILDRKGYKARWLEEKVTPEDEDRLMEEYQLEAFGDRYGCFI